MLTWSFEETDEMWTHDEFETEEECILDAKENYKMKQGEQIAIGKMYPYVVCADVESLLDRLEEDAYEECGEAAENWEITSRKHFEKERDLLQEKVTECVNEYLKAIGEEPTFYKIDDIYTVAIN